MQRSFFLSCALAARFLLSLAAVVPIASAQTPPPSPVQKQLYDLGTDLKPLLSLPRPMELEDEFYFSRPGKRSPDAAKFRWDRQGSALIGDPVYPFELRRARKAGKVSIKFVVTPDGRPTDIEIVETTAPEFAEALKAVVEAGTYKPATTKGVPSHARANWTYEFDPWVGNGKPAVDGIGQWILRELERGKDFPLVEEAARNRTTHKPPVHPGSLQGVKGTAVVEMFIDHRGVTQLPRIVSASHVEFGYAAAQAVSGWRYDPIPKGKLEDVVRVQLTFTFDARDGQQADPTRSAPEPGT